VPPDEEESVLLSVKDKIRAIDLTTEEQRLEADKEIGKQERRIARGLLHCPGTFSLMVCNVFITTSDVTGLIDRDGATIVVTMYHRLSKSNMRLWYFFFQDCLPFTVAPMTTLFLHSNSSTSMEYGERDYSARINSSLLLRLSHSSTV
jgi:hypothetical protein